jgi:hypothetical protein
MPTFDISEVMNFDTNDVLKSMADQELAVALDPLKRLNTA